MALIKTSSLISDIRGKVQASIFQGSLAGLTLRSGVKGINKNSLRQNKTRNITFRIQQEWRLLSNAERNLWLQFTNFNPILQKRSNELFINEQQNFIKFNSYRLEYGLNILKTPQFTKCEILPINLSVSSTGAAISITADRQLNEALEFIILFLTIPFIPTINNPGSRLKLIKFTTTNNTTFDVTTPYKEIFGSIPQPGQKIFFKFSNADKASGIIFPFKTKSVIL
ncbi:MAG: hypothetical protein IID03_11405 [Candidatus Dadabacteria bacterium]|nr:hypothetical protein [Candidatus Dadabacteria bacterium]